jgi:hypothetical protein
VLPVHEEKKIRVGVRVGIGIGISGGVVIIGL